MENSYSHNPEGLTGLQVPSGIPVHVVGWLPYTNERGEEMHAFTIQSENKLFVSQKVSDMLKNYSLNIYEDAELWHCIEVQTARPAKQPWWKRLVRALFDEPRTWPQPTHLYLPTGLPSLKGAQVSDAIVWENVVYVIVDKQKANPVIVASAAPESSMALFKEDPL